MPNRNKSVIDEDRVKRLVDKASLDGSFRNIGEREMKTEKEIRTTLATTIRALRNDHKVMEDEREVTYDVGYIRALYYVLKRPFRTYYLKGIMDW